MDWRVTARSGKPHTKVFQEEREQGLLLVMDQNPGMRFGTQGALQERPGRARRGAARLDGRRERRSHRRARFRRRHQRRSEAGRRHAAACCACLRALRDWDAGADPARNEPLSLGLARVRRLLRPGMRMILTTDGFSADAEAAQLLPQLAGRHEVSVVLLRDALELAAPPPGRYAVHLGTARRVLDFGDASVRARAGPGVSPTRASACAMNAAAPACACSMSTRTPTFAARSRR